MMYTMRAVATTSSSHCPHRHDSLLCEYANRGTRYATIIDRVTAKASVVAKMPAANVATTPKAIISPNISKVLPFDIGFLILLVVLSMLLLTILQNSDVLQIYAFIL